MSNFLTDWPVLTSFVVNYLFHSTLLLAGCWIFLAATRIDSRYLAERLWKLAAVLGILTAAFQVALLPAVPEHHDVSDEQVTVAELDTTIVYVVPDDSLVVSESTLPRDSAKSRLAASVNTNLSDVVSLEMVQSYWLPNALHYLMVVACNFVAISVVTGTLLALWHSFRLRRHFSDARPIQVGVASEALGRLLKRTGVHRKVRLLESPRQTEPIAFGLFRWTIVLPQQVEERLEAAELDALLAHEVAHLVRGDVWWLWLGRALCTCFAIQPLNLLARRRWQQAAEYLCDEWAVESGVESLSLARCLTKIAEWRLHARSTAFGLAAGGSRSTLMQRVERLVSSTNQPDHWQKPSRRRSINLVAFASIVLIIGFAPRLALPVVELDVPRGHMEVSSEAWREAEEELMQLEADFDRAVRLLESSSTGDEVAELVQSFRKRMESIQIRRTRVRSFIEGSQR